ncbi:MAG: hypothetical protein SBU_000989 [Candidatus Syntrophoarchaeum butanivorans]|nr:MAG: hypothetical protein SBU_000989 [Candidatus Syntrophoarchaeum butanivorans]
MLERISNDYVRLYFLERKKNQRTGEISYKVLRSEISPEIGDELINSAKVLIKNQVEESVSYVEYEPDIYYDTPTIEIINPSEVPHFDFILSELSNQNLEILNLRHAKNLTGYIVTVDVVNTSHLIFMRKYTIKKLLDRGKINMLFHGSEGRFSQIRDSVIAVDKTFDVAFVVSEDRKKGFIFNKGNFESLFNLIETYSQLVSENLNVLEEKELIENVGELIDICSGDLRKIRKLCRVLRNENAMGNITLEKINEFVQDYNLQNVEFADGGKIKVTKRNIWTVLKLLNDDYVRSDMTETKYEAHSKKTIG